MITASNNLKFNNDSTTDYNKITFKDKIYFGSGDNQKQLEFKKDGRVFYNGIQVYYTCRENCVDCYTCNSCTTCNGICHNCTACNGNCTACNGCTSCFNCASCFERCNACTICHGCYTTCVNCVNCQKKCNSCYTCNDNNCNGCYNYSCQERTGCSVGANPGAGACNNGCMTCDDCNGGCYNKAVHAGCQDCNSSCYFWDGAVGDCDPRYAYYYVLLKNPR